jgi:hypothetical protein
MPIFHTEIFELISGSGIDILGQKIEIIIQQTKSVTSSLLLLTKFVDK